MMSQAQMVTILVLLYIDLGSTKSLIRIHVLTKDQLLLLELWLKRVEYLPTVHLVKQVKLPLVRI